MAGRGFSLDDTLEAVATVEAARSLAVSPLVGEYHPMLRHLMESRKSDIYPAV